MRILNNYGDFTGSLIRISFPAYVCLAAQLAIRGQLLLGSHRIGDGGFFLKPSRRMYLFPQPAVWTCMLYPFPPPVGLTYWLLRVSISTTSRKEWQVVSLSTASSIDVQGVSIFHNQQNGRGKVNHFHRQQYGREGCRGVSPSTASSMNVYRVCPFCPFPLPAVWACRVCPFLPPAVWTCRVYPSF